MEFTRNYNLLVWFQLAVWNTNSKDMRPQDLSNQLS